MTVAGWKYAGLYVQQFVLASTGEPLRVEPFTVFASDGVTPATIYADQTKAAPVANPTITDAYGNGHFYADPGEYVVSCHGGTVRVAVAPWHDELSVVALDQNPLYEDVTVPLLSATVGPSTPGLDVFTDAVRAYAFDAGSIEQLFVSVQLPHSWVSDLGAGPDTIFPHLHWAPKTTNALRVRWGLEYTWQNIAGVFGVSATITVEQNAAGVALTHQVAQFPSIAVAGKKRSAIFMARLFREANHANDDFTGDAYALSFDLHAIRRGSGSAVAFPAT